MVGKSLIATILGLVLSVSGIVVGYLFLDGLANEANFLLLGGAVVLIAGGVFCFVKGGKSDALGVKKVKSEPIVLKEGQNILEKNNAMLGDYNKTADTRDRLKMLEAAGDKNVI